MNNKTTAFIGAGLLVVGLFVPVVTLPFVGSVSLFANGTNILAYLLLALAGLAAFAAFKGTIRDAMAPAIAALVLVIAKFIELQITISNMKDELATSMRDNPFAGIAEGLSNAVQIEWGWLVLIAGAGALIYAAIQARKDDEYVAEPDSLVRYGSIAIAAIGLGWMVYHTDVFRDGDFNSAGEISASEGAEMEAPFGAALEGNEASEAEAAYIRDNVEVYDLSARYMDSMLDGRVPGVDFKIKNKGQRSLDEVQVTVIFYDKDGNAIAEDEFYPVLVSGFDNDPPLRPGYIWQQERGRFYSAKSVPTEWEAGKATAKVTAIEFSD